MNKDRLLIEASRIGLTTVVKYILKKGADPKAYNSLALRWAISNRHKEVIEMLIAAGANPKTINSYALFWTTSNEHKEVVELLKRYM